MKTKNIFYKIFLFLCFAGFLFLTAFKNKSENIQNSIISNYVTEKDAVVPFQNTNVSEDGLENFKKWKGTFHYELNYSDDIFEPGVSFLKMNGLRGEEVERITLDGNINFTPKVGNSIYIGRGVVNYSVSLMNYSALGEAMVIHFTNGKGSAKIKPLMELIDDDSEIDEQIRIEYQTRIKFDYRNSTYDMRITPGDYDADLDEFGVPVESSSRINVTKAMIRKLEEEGRSILYPETLNEMFPDRPRELDRLDVTVEAFGMPFSYSRNILKGSYKDEKGGILSWKFVAY
ncbi:MAG: hypothetical protein L3J25_04180 [Flavobacteriaceae bacterium]|nr:hypothetical protein [Flavobacteriaceae bacterium]